MKFEISGYNLNNLVMILNSKNVILKNVVYTKNKLSFETDDKNEKIVQRYIANFKVKKGGKKSKRVTNFILSHLSVLIAVFVGSVFMLFASNYTWNVEVQGLTNLTKQDILEVLKENNIKIGKINLQTREEIENILLNNYNQIAQVSVIRIGTTIVINLSEKLVYNNNEYLPIVAKYSGIVTDIKIVTGTTNVKVGDYVNVGDVLVLPFNLDKDGNKISVEPIAIINADIFVTEICELKKEERILVETGKQIVAYNYKLKNINLFSGKNKNSFALFNFVVYNENVSNFIPLIREVITYKELTTSIKINNFDEQKENLMQKCSQNARKKLSDKEILDEITEIKIFEDKMIACTKLKVKGQINDWIFWRA